MSVSIASSPLWQTGGEVFKEFSTIYSHFCTTFDKFGGPLMHKSLKIFSKDFKVACVVNGKEEKICVASPNVQSGPEAFPYFPYLCLVPIIVTPEVCDEEGTMPIGAINALMDMITSFHIMMAAFPEKPGHVSVTIQTNSIRPPRLGEQFVVVSKIDKMGRRLVFTSVQYLEPIIEKKRQNVPDAVWEEMKEMKTIQHLLVLTQYAEVLANIKHVKSLLSASANQQAKDQRETPKEVVEGEEK